MIPIGSELEYDSFETCAQDIADECAGHLATAADRIDWSATHGRTILTFKHRQVWCGKKAVGKIRISEGQVEFFSWNDRRRKLATVELGRNTGENE